MNGGLTIDNPVSFAEAIASNNVIPGDTLLLRAGTYTGYWLLGIGGTVDAPVTIRPYQNEQVIIDGGLTFLSPYLHIYDLDIMDSNPDRHVITNSITMDQVGCWLVGCHIYNLHNSGVNWFGSGAGKIAECWIEGNGYIAGDESNHGHNIYSHNNLGGERRIERNLLGNSLGDYALQIFSAGTNALRDYVVKDNVINGDPVIIGGGLGIDNLLFDGNVENGDVLRIGSTSLPDTNVTITNNWLIDADNYFEYLEPATISGNISWGQTPSYPDGYTVQAKPDTWSKLIPFSLSSRWSGIQINITDGVFSAAMVDV